MFAQAVAQVAVAAGRDDTLPMLTGVRMEIEGSTLTLLATDRYRLAIRELDWTPRGRAEPARCWSRPARWPTPPRRSAPAAGRRGAGTAAGGDGMIGFTGGARRTTSRLLDAEFPKIRSLFPDQHNDRARSRDVAALTEVVKRVALVADRNTPVRLQFGEGEVVVEAGGSEDAGPPRRWRASRPASS